MKMGYDKFMKSFFLDRHIAWSVDDEPDGMSVSPVTFHLFITFSRMRFLREYTSLGQLIREIKLPSDIIHPFHAVEVATDRFVVTHGRHSDARCRVCFVNARDGISETCFGSSKR
jgi:hypothetical protein